MEDKNAEVPNSRKISRREFLKLGGAVAAGAATGYVAWRLGLKKPDTAETMTSPEIELKPSVKVLDFFDVDKARNKYLQDSFPHGFSEEKSWREMGVMNPSNVEELKQATPKDGNQIKLLLMTYFRYYHQNHGTDVVAVMKKTTDFLNPDQPVPVPDRASIADAVKFGQLEYDEIGNPTIHIKLSMETVDKLISNSPESVINMSLELGHFALNYTLFERKQKFPEVASRQNPSKVTIGGVTSYRDYQGNKISEQEYEEILKRMDEKVVTPLSPSERDFRFLDGYAGVYTYPNLRELAEVAKRHPQKIFVAAGGNPTYFQGLRRVPDIREARAKLEEEGLWPDNLIIVGFQGRESGVIGPASLGADIYVSDRDLKSFGFSGASSYATPVVTAIAQQMVAGGLKNCRELKEGLMQLTQKAELEIDSEKVEYQLLDLNRAKDALSNLRTGK